MNAAAANRIDRARLGALLAEEERAFAADHPRSAALFAAAKATLLDGVPMNWMVRWAGPFPLFVESAGGARFTDVDGRSYVDLCLGDTGAMAGHSPPETVAAIAARLQRGITFMLPTADAAWVGGELGRRFGLPLWQFALTATDANRFALRLARHVTGRRKVLVFNWCYHGSVDETFATLRPDGSVGPRPGLIGPPVDPAETTRVVEFNDVGALEAALADRAVACVLAEPALTNIGIVLPEPGFHEALRRLTRDTGTLLILDETHTICSGPGGYSGAHGLAPDMLTIGKPIAGGLPAAAYGMTAALGERIRAAMDRDTSDTGGIGGTLAGNALSLAAMRATLASPALGPESFARTIALAGRFREGVQQAIDEYGLPWHVTQLGCRAEYWFRPVPPRNGGEAAAAADAELDRYLHLAALNRGVLLTPFHNMALVAPSATEADIDRHTAAFRESVRRLVG
ncbi:MAG: aspartate aminotransferase family protein [Dongiaceae bacterium]